MLRKILKSILNNSTKHKHSSSSKWHRSNHNRHSHYGHSHYKRKNKSSFFSSFKSFYSS